MTRRTANRSLPQPRRTFIKTGAALALAPLVSALASARAGAASPLSSQGMPNQAASGPGPMSRSMTIDLTSWIPNLKLSFGDAASQDGAPPHAAHAQLAAGQRVAVRAANRHGGCAGSFSLKGGDAAFAVSYAQPSGTAPATLSVMAAPGYVTGADAATFPGRDAKANVNLYRGVPTRDGAWVVPLGLLHTPPHNNCQDFANSMFGSHIRDASVIQSGYRHAGTDGYVPPADFSGGQLAGFVAQWVRRWLDGSAYTMLPASDAKLIDLLKHYVKSASSNGPLTMWVPQIAYQAGTSPAGFNLSGYRSFSFVDTAGRWNAAQVSAFLTLLAAGSHFVAISATSDLPEGVSMQSFDTFIGASGLPSRHDVGSSHYTPDVNVTGTYYPSVDGDFAPADLGLILTFLYGKTINQPVMSPGTYNTFIQLEGWQAGGARHNADYDTYKQTLWNISTYGASAYTEKRATSIFLAPPGWTPQIYQTTRMMPYVGAYANANGTPQHWLNTSLVSIPADAPPLPARYVL